MSLRAAGDVLMSVLGDEGVLFSESRQELYTLNTAATFLWCLLDEGHSSEAILDRYVETFQVARAQAEHDVRSTLRRWYALGYVAGSPSHGPADTPLATALAYLLTNADLRKEYATAADRTAETLGVRDEDRHAFVSLDPGALEAQADEINIHRNHQRHALHGSSSSLDPDLLAIASDPSLWSSEEPRVQRGYRLLRTTFCVDIPTDVDAMFRPSLVHLETNDSAKADVRLRIGTLEGRCIVWDGMMPVAQCASAEGLLPILLTLFRKLAVARHRYFIEIHAGVVAYGDRCLLLSAPAGSGKSTLTAALVAAGATYFSDEIALLEEHSLDIAPMPLALTVKSGSVEPLATRYSSIASLPEHRRDDHQRVRYLPPPEGSRCPPDRIPCPAAWVVFPQYESGCETALTEISVTEGLRRLMDQALVLPQLLDRQAVQHLIAWVRELQFYELRLSSLDEAERLLRGLTSPKRLSSDIHS